MENPNPEDTIKTYLSEKGIENLSTLASISGTSEERAKYIVLGLRDGGKVRYFGDEHNF